MLWLRYLSLDALMNYVLMPDTPRRYCLHFYNKEGPLSEKGLDLYMTFAGSVKIIDESVWMSRLPGQTCPPTFIIASTVTKALMMAHNPKLREECHQPAIPDRDIFHQIAELLLRAASPAGVSMSYPVSAEVERHNLLMHSYDRLPYRGNFYNYRGCIILLTKDCSNGERLEANIGLAVAHAQETGTDTSTVIILSIWHVAVVLISGAVFGKLEVSQSRAYPFLAGFGSEEFDTALSLLAHYLRPRCVDGPFPTRDVNRGDQSGCTNQSLPFDILVQIMPLVDFRTYDAFSLVSKSLRREWFLHPRICNYTISHAKDMGGVFYRGFPRCTIQATREEDGEPVTLYLSYKVPCLLEFPEDYYGRFGTVYDLPCCECPNLCINKFCRKSVVLRMPVMDQNRLWERVRNGMKLILDSASWENPAGDNHFTSTFPLCLSILDLSKSCGRCMAADVAGRMPTSLAEDYPDKRKGR